ncbi:hypothetical protein T8S45_07005 [Blastomonas marina]|uniref:hypothetical protein n=1 Tax=Blastomonas marina TaxID=1867408 RepID=UPI002AC9EFBB|nr:hypothetical protein [Blastomonas marina]WPZ02605.1 hypothetical protein T8S45_07005 [Blastomonas marina]
MPKFTPYSAMLAVGIGLASTAPGAAQDPDVQPAPLLAEDVANVPDQPTGQAANRHEALPDEAMPAPARDDSLPLLLSEEELAETRGKATIVINDQDLKGIVSGNSLGDYVAGSILLSDNALSNFTGVGNFLFNTGAQNNLQAGMTLTITIEN